MFLASIRRSPAWIALASITLIGFAVESAWADRYSDAVAHEGRPTDALKRDQSDHPSEVKRLSDMLPYMVASYSLAADGYYSELLSYLVGPKGHVYLLNN